MNWARVSVEADGERGQDGAAVAFGPALDRFLDMLEARLDGNPVTRKQRKLRRATGQPFEGGKTVGDRS